MHEVIVVGVDGTVGGSAATTEAAGLARRFNARLITRAVDGAGAEAVRIVAEHGVGPVWPDEELGRGRIE